MEHRLYDALDKIHAEDKLKNRTKAFLFEKTGGYKKYRRMPVQGLLMAGVCMALFLTIGCFAYLTPVFAISLDVNPSIELGVNRFDKVIAVDTYNEDGDEVMSGLDIYHLDYKEALGLILADGYMERYLAQEHVIAVTVCGANEDKCSQMVDHVAACTSSYDNIYYCDSSSEEVAEAHAAGISFGKYKAFLELQELDPDITVEDIQGLTMRQIWDKIELLSGNTGTDTRNNRHGTGCKRGEGKGTGRDNQQGGCGQHGHHR